jgi:hypothetical protein
MDRFSEESPLMAARAARYETFSAPDEPEEIEEPLGCNHDFVREDDTQCTCLECGETWEVQEEPAPVVLRVLQAVECVQCRSTRRTVVSDRLYVSSEAVCCEREVA